MSHSLKFQESSSNFWLSHSPLPPTVDVICDLSLREIGQFLGHNLTKEQVDTLCHSTNIDTMRSTSKSFGTNEQEKEFAEKFFRKGKVGGWAEYFHGERLEEFNKWIDENLEGSDIELPKS